MGHSVKIAWGSFMVILGVMILAWAGYNTFIEMQPSAEGKNLTLSAGFAVAIVIIGTIRIRSGLRGQQAASE